MSTAPPTKRAGPIKKFAPHAKKSKTEKELDQSVDITRQTQENFHHVVGDEDYHFAMQVLASIKRLENKKKALAKLHIHQYLTSIEYGLDYNRLSQPVTDEAPPTNSTHLDISRLNDQLPTPWMLNVL